MTSHGPTHLEGVATLVAELSKAVDFLTESETFVLLAAAYLHDVGMYETSDCFYSQPMAIRDIHGPLSRVRVLRERDLLLPTLKDNDSTVELIALLCAYHQGKAPLSEEEQCEIEEKKRLRDPDYARLSAEARDRLAQSQLATDDLPAYPSLQRNVAALSHRGLQCFSLPQVQDAGICPFRLAGLLKLLDGCDFQTSRAGSIETILRHADRNASHATRSSLILQDSGKGSPSSQRAALERDFFSGSVFHFLRNLVIERTLIMPADGPRSVQVVVKPADPDEILDLCRRAVAATSPDSATSDSRPRKSFDLLTLMELYQGDPEGAIRRTLQDWPKRSLDGFLHEWQVKVAEDQRNDRRTIHALVAKKYIEREFEGIADLLDGPADTAACCYCEVCVKRPGGSWWNTTDGFDIKTYEAPEASEQEIRNKVMAAVGDETLAEPLCSIWMEFGGEPVAGDLLDQLVAANWDREQLPLLFESNLADFFARDYTATTLGGMQEMQVLQLVALLNENVTPSDVEALFGTREAKDEGPLQKLSDRGLIRALDGRLSSHAACVAGHARTRWMDRVASHPWPLLVAFAGLAGTPATAFRAGWDRIGCYLPELDQLRQVPSGQRHMQNALAHSLRTLARLDEILENLNEVLPAWRNSVENALVQVPGGIGRSMGRKTPFRWPIRDRRGLLRVAALFHDIGKHRTCENDGGRISFHGHEQAGAETWREKANRFGVPDGHVEHVGHLIEAHLYPLSLFYQFSVGECSDHAVDRMIKLHRDVLPGLLLLFLADADASGTMEEQRPKILEFLDHVLSRLQEVDSEGDKEANRITGRDLMKAGLEPGTRSGKAFGAALEAANAAARSNPALTDEELIALSRRVFEEHRAPPH